MAAPLELRVLLMEDTPDDMEQLLRTLPKDYEDCKLVYEPCESFEEMRKLVAQNRYDLILTDTYEGSAAMKRRPSGAKVATSIRGRRFCPVVIFSSGSCPEELEPGAFLRWSEKDKIEDEMKAILETGVPQVARRLHDELDATAGNYLWGFLESNWELLTTSHDMTRTVLERLVRRRASLQLGDLDNDASTTRALERVEGFEYYIYPAIPSETRNMGDVVRSKEDAQAWSVILTPHCHLAIQDNEKVPRADHVLLAEARPCSEVLTERYGAKDPWGGSADDKQRKLRGRTSAPAQSAGRPDGRNWFLPAFCEIPHLFCDFMRVRSVPLSELLANYDVIATLASPYAESMQACFVRFYGAVGLPSIGLDGVRGIMD